MPQLPRGYGKEVVDVVGNDAHMAVTLAGAVIVAMLHWNGRRCG